MSRTPLLIYGANGYTGALIARRAAAQGVAAVLAGRDGAAVAALAEELRLSPRVFALDDPAAVAAGLQGTGALLNCAGPFSRTAAPLVDACLWAGVHYLDITGEIGVLETLAGRDAEAGTAGVTLLPGAGFDVVRRARACAQRLAHAANRFRRRAACRHHHPVG